MEYRAFLGTCCEGMRRKRTDRNRERERGADCAWAVLYSRVGMLCRNADGREALGTKRRGDKEGRAPSSPSPSASQWGRYFKNRILIRAGNTTLCNPYVSTWWMRGLAHVCVCAIARHLASCLSHPSSHSRCLQLFPSWSYSFFILNYYYYYPSEALFFPSLFAVSGIPRLLCILTPRASACSSGNSGTAHMRRKERRKGEGEAVFLKKYKERERGCPLFPSTLVLPLKRFTWTITLLLIDFSDGQDFNPSTLRQLSRS
ncbi:hypothetical protein KQX54_005633 [Cotesia glomerata]|uniref:Uncharacterized protein n=1 Tax=Cotesia glomerata TaxID=32391 RepID=A0AAV7I741_COTGL|nr:hypothetical protein KQX54_005633 [Cotesia glomerata]